MILDAYKDTEIAYLFKIFDLDAENYIEHVIRANQETGEYDIYEFDEDGNVSIDIATGRPEVVKLKGNIVLVYKGEV